MVVLLIVLILLVVGVIILLVVGVSKFVPITDSLKPSKGHNYYRLQGKYFFADCSSQEENFIIVEYFTSLGFEYLPQYSSQETVCFRIPFGK